MTNEVKPSVRLVRCPKCRRVLQEPPKGIYKCGGCGAILEAKKRKNENPSTEPRVPETHPPPKSEQIRDSKEKEICSLHEKDSSFASADTLLGESGNTQYEVGECSNSSKEKFSDELQCSPHHENDGDSSNAREPIEQHEDDKCHVDGSFEFDGYENDSTVDRNISGELSESDELKHRETEAREQMEVDEEGKRCEYEMESPEYTNSPAGSFPFTRCTGDDNEVGVDVGKSRPLSQESDQNDFSGHIVEYIENEKSSGEIVSPECHKIEKPSPVHTEVDQSPFHEGILSDRYEQPEQSDKAIARGFDHISSVENLETLPLDDRSQRTRSYYAYDGSESSCDGDNQVANKFSKLRRKFENAKLIRPDEFQSDDASKENILPSRKPPKTMLPRRMHRAGEGLGKVQDKWPESRRCGQTFGNRRQSEMDEYVSTLPVSIGSPVSHGLHHPSSFYPSYADLEKMQLLRMVRDLEEQLHKTRLSKGNMRDDIHAFQFHPDADAGHYRYPVRYSQGRGFPKQSKMPRIPFSGEAVHYRRHQGDCLCLHCSPQVWHCSSSQLPLGSICCNHNNFCNAPSPQRYANSEYSKWCHNPKPSDPRHKDHETRKLHSGERYAKKRHVLPVAGGAPIVTCHHCSELLQLPADFGVSRRRCYKLRCNACTKVLKFDNLSKNDDSGYDMVEQPEILAPAPPPSEVGESSYLNESSAAPQRCPHAESLSYSDDLGPSFCRSCSTEVESSSVTPIQPHGRRSNFNRKASSASSLEPVEDRKMKSVMTESQTKLQGRFESAGPSKWGNSTSEIEEEHPTTGSPLHRLMGYSTVSQVFK